MTTDPVAGTRALWTTLTERVDFFGTAGPAMPDDRTLGRLLHDGALLLPHGYQEPYIAPVLHAATRLLALARAGRIRMSSVEIVTGAIIQHVPDWPLANELRRFTAVISNLYRSFLDAARREAANLPTLATCLPPLAAFQHDGSNGPITIASDLIATYLGGSVGVVALPATFAHHPILWTALAHETGGHDVTHADVGLLDQLTALLPSVLTPLEADCKLPRGVLVRLWAHWMDEAAADIYAIMNAGPAFVENAVVLLTAMGGGDAPRLRAESRTAGPERLDPHPTDILRLHLGLGAIATLDHFSGRAAAAARIAALLDAICPDTEITLKGSLADGQQRLLPIEESVPREAMGRAAEAVGRLIATARLPALDGKSIQNIERWDDDDVRAVDTVRNGLAAGRSISGLGDDAQLLAAASAAVIDDAASYDNTTQWLNQALDHSFHTDPVWGYPDPDQMYVRYK